MRESNANVGSRWGPRRPVGTVPIPALAGGPGPGGRTDPRTGTTATDVPLTSWRRWTVRDDRRPGPLRRAVTNGCCLTIYTDHDDTGPGKATVSCRPSPGQGRRGAAIAQHPSIYPRLDYRDEVARHGLSGTRAFGLVERAGNSTGMEQARRKCWPGGEIGERRGHDRPGRGREAFIAMAKPLDAGRSHGGMVERVSATTSTPTTAGRIGGAPQICPRPNGGYVWGGPALRRAIGPLWRGERWNFCRSARRETGLSRSGGGEGWPYNIAHDPGKHITGNPDRTEWGFPALEDRGTLRCAGTSWDRGPGPPEPSRTRCSSLT